MNNLQMGFEFDVDVDVEASAVAEDDLDSVIATSIEDASVDDKNWDGIYEVQYVHWLENRVLEDAVANIRDPRSGKKTKRESAEWLFSDLPGRFSFVTIVRLFGADPDKFRELIVQMPDVRRGLAMI